MSIAVVGKIIRITEYEPITPRSEGFTEERFELLENFILSNTGDETSPLELMALSAKKGVGKTITAKNYVGVISLSDGTRIEILPKVYGRLTPEGKEDELRASKRILIDMLRALRTAPGKSVQSSDMETARMPLFEVFVRMFIDEVFGIVKRGLKGGYTLVNRNEPFMKGKIRVAQNIRENLAHAERFHVEYDEFDFDQPENRLIKAALEYLGKKSHDTHNRQDIRALLSWMDGIGASSDVNGDLKKASVTDRHNAYYRTALIWCGVFLRGETFTPFAGEAYATAILFPMDVLYEAYVAKRLKGHLKGFDVRTQDRGLYLFRVPRMFALRPDIVISDGKKTVILDTKWKLLVPDMAKNYGISQADMYQMYAYFREYDAHGANVGCVMTLYPETKTSIGVKDFTNDDLSVGVRFLDLTDGKASFERLAGEIKGVLKASEVGAD